MDAIALDIQYPLHLREEGAGDLLGKGAAAERQVAFTKLPQRPCPSVKTDGCPDLKVTCGLGEECFQLAIRQRLHWALLSCAAHILNSGIFATGSSALMVRRFAGASLKWNGINRTPSWAVSVMRATVLTSPRRVLT